MKQHIIIALFFIPSFVFAQTYNAESINKKALDVYENAMVALRDGFIKDAIPMLNKAIEYDAGFIDAYLSLAGVYGELKDYKKSVFYY